MIMDSSRKLIKYIYDLPYSIFKEISKFLNINNKWEEFARNVEFDELTIQNFKRKENPATDFLNIWGIKYNHTILELFAVSFETKCSEVMILLKPLVDVCYHAHIDKILKDKTNDKMPQTQENGESSSAYEYTSDYNSTCNASENKDLLSISLESFLVNVTNNELRLATQNWDSRNILGKGHFGTVFKGKWKGTNIAVKKLNKNLNDQSDNSSEFNSLIQETLILQSRPHYNILQLYAYSCEELLCLVYELMENGSLRNNLCLRNNRDPLTWIQRHEIAQGVARGLQYLHTIGEKPFVHGDIKSENILLNKYFVPKIGDFGLARECQKGETIKVNKVFGTKHYLPDEYLYEHLLSTKVDTYSYGIVLFELATGLPAIITTENQKQPLKKLIYKYDENRVINLIDKKAGEQYVEVFKILITLGKYCTSELLQDRPEMTIVYEKIENNII